MKTMAMRTPAAAKSPRSPLSSPTRLAASLSKRATREEEKQELQHLNDRLATYIDRVKALEAENSKLTTQITTTKDTVEREVDNVKKMYETELDDARRLLDDTAKEKARQQIANSKNAALVEELGTKLNKETTERKKIEETLTITQKQLSDKESHLSRVNQEARNLDKVVKELTKECQELKDALESAKYSLEQETLTRVDLENKLQSLREELNFKKQVYNKEISDIRTQMKTVETKRVTVETDYANKYEGILREKLQELRENYEEENRRFRDDTEKLYGSKYEDLKSQHEGDADQLAQSRSEVYSLNSELDTIRSEVNQMRAKSSGYEARIRDLELLRDNEKENYRNALDSRDEEIKELRQQMDEAVMEYEKLMGVKVALDMEIMAYRNLLEGEEARLQIKAPPSPVLESESSGSSKTRLSAKRARTEEESVSTTATAEGNIQIVESDADGKFVRLYNSGDQDEALGGWTIQRQVGDEQAVVYKFTPKYSLKVGNYVTVWAAKGGGHHKPPHELVFKQQDNWGTGKDVRTALVDPSGQEMAILTEEKVLTTSYSDVTDSRPRVGRRSGGDDVAKGCIVQ